jgi:hypothetical protein
MQWDAVRNGGFSTAPPRRLVQRVVPDGFGPEHVNVAHQKRDHDSLWHFMRTLIQTYRECPELGWGDFTVLEQPCPQVLAHRCHWDGASVVAVHNLSAHPLTTRVQLHDDDVAGPDGETLLDDLFAHEAHTADPKGGVELNLAGYGHAWLRVRRDGRPRR